ncbi:MAG TPA: hypothetical protein K8W23_03510, partial [Sellimonas intestinalis]|nr:hypothetical protein [Sellimonas intestinalis]
MWNRKQLKKRGREALKKNWWRLIGISLMLAFLAGGMRVIYRTPEGVAMVLDVNVRTQSNAHILNDWFSSVKQSEDTQTGQILGFLGEHYTPKKGVLAGVYNHMTKERSAFFGLLNALNDVLFKDKITEGVLILIGALLMMMFQVFISGVLQVGYCRFLLENRIYGQVR